MKISKSVKRPERTVIVKGKSADYVYLTQSVSYKKELKCSRPKRILIGKLDEDGNLIPNSNYIELFPKEELMDATDRADFLSVGAHMIVEAIAKSTGLDLLLNNVFKEYASYILDVATYMIMNESNAMLYFEDYGYSHSLFTENNFSDNTIGRLLKEISVQDIDTFIKAWVNMYVNKDIYVSYDSTNMNSVAGHLELAEYGHAKDNPDLPQVNVSLGYNQNDQIPLFYEMFPGSIIDNTECEKMVERSRYYGCEKIAFILDRGYFSIGNIKFFEKNGYDYMLMTKGNAKFVKESINECGAILKNGYSNYIEEHELYGMTLEKEMFSTGKKQYVHLYYNGMQAEKEKIDLNNRFNRMDKAMEDKVQKKLQRKEDIGKMDEYYRTKFDENGYLLSYKRKEEKQKERIEKLGYFAIITSKEMKAKEALDIYRDRDAVEKIFRMEKSYLGCDVFRVHTSEKLESKMFISFIGLIIRNEIHKKIKPLYRKNRKEYTVSKVLKQLERLGLTKLSDEKYHIRYRLTSKQKAILQQFDLNENDYKLFAENVIGSFE